MAELLLEQDEPHEAKRLRAEVHYLRARVEEQFWMEDRGFYAFALDREKRRVEAIASNPSHLLWCGLPAPERAATVTKRCLEPDLFSGWGLRTLSSHNPAYNPLSYQRGSVWPHDPAIAAAGIWRYGLHEAACTLIRAILEAAYCFEEDRLPELFCGLDRSQGPPVPYEEANVPQAWAAAVPMLITQLLLGLIPDVPRSRCFVSPWLPPWLPRLELRGIKIGAGSLDIALARQGEQTVIEESNTEHLTVVRGTEEAPLWGTRYSTSKLQGLH